MIAAPVPPRPWSIAHRGASAYAPENTLAAFRKAAELGADMWEADIRSTADGVAVVYHDATVPDGRAVADLSRAELLEALPDCPTVAEMVALAAELGAGIYADIKDLSATVPTLRLLEEAEIEPVVLGAFDVSVVDTLREAGSRYPVSGLVPLGADPFDHAGEADVIHLCWERMDRPQDTLTQDLFEQAFARGQRVVLWHEEDPDRMADIRTKPVTGICSDMPELVNPFVPPSEYPFGIVCHRGANGIAPENTLPAFECALAAGFDFIELDLHVTADEQIVVMHDDTLDRTTSGTGTVWEQSMEALRRLDAGEWFDPYFAGTGLPSLGEVLALLHKYGGGAYLELKSAPPALVLRQVQEAGLLDQVFFWSFNREFLQELRRLSPKARIMARRQDYPTLREALEDYDADILEFLPNHEPLEVASLRGGAVRSMIAYNGADPAVYDRMLAMRPDLFNLDQPFAFSRHARAFVHG